MNGLSGIEEVVDAAKRTELISYQGLSHITPTLRLLLPLRVYCITIIRNDPINFFKLFAFRENNIDHYIDTGRLILETFSGGQI